MDTITTDDDAEIERQEASTLRARVGMRLREIREAKGLSLNDLAKRIGVTRQAVFRWETGLISLDLEKARKISVALNMKLSKLLAKLLSEY